ncbi:MAG TPA: hypothetical protein VFQ77_08360 [Pseudonocardiaceae bacterium]|jgi:hypothetical protein|nr:hypothetical protein [Pseudonocardiaceae bacterium]
MTQQRSYAEYVPPRGLGGIWWKLTSPARLVYAHLRRAYHRRRPPPEVSAYLGMSARVVGEDLTPNLPVGSMGIVTRSEVRDGDRIYVIEFDTENETVCGELPCERHFELSLGPHAHPAGGGLPQPAK